ncbi:GNAT family N-acetyltransferase [Paenibacillus terreus]|uniref:GNAT family N-acetyltransferase n=1 Tax=Paenibacillus terreus TaxID=1387834 RepID=A0ABV5B9J9_9BACL
MNERKPSYYLEQIEKMELELTQLNASRSLVPVERQLEVLRVGNSILLRDRTDPASMYYNRIKGFGLPDLPDLDKLLSYYQVSPCFDMTPDHMTAEVARSLSDRGFIPVEQLVFMYVNLLKEKTESAQNFHIERVTEHTAEEFIRWIELSKKGVQFTQEMIARSKSYLYSPSFLNYMLRIDGEPAAMGSLFLHGEEGYIANDYTFEAYRGRGCQGALLRQRLSDAASLGVKTVYTDVEFGSTSHGNMVKAGFKTAFLNTFWMKK